MRVDKFGLFAQMLADGKISVDEYARLINLTANAEERVNKSFLTETSAEIAIHKEDIPKVSDLQGSVIQRDKK